MAIVSTWRARSCQRPPASVRTESTGPPPPAVTWCSTTQRPASGTPVGPPRRRTPDTAPPPAPPWDARVDTPAPSSARSAPTVALRRELAEILRIEILEVVLERVGIEGLGAALSQVLGGVDGGVLEQVLAREDRRLEAQRHRDRVRGTRIDIDDRVAAVDVQLGVVGVVLHPGDDHLAQVGAQTDDHLLEQVVGERPGELHPRQLHRDRARLGRPDPDRQHPLAVLLLQNDDRSIARLVEPEVGDANFDHEPAQVPWSQEAR